MILVDTSIWIEHLRKTHKQFSMLLESGEVAIHPFIVGELACGNLKNRQEILSLLKDLPQVAQVENEEVFHLIEKYKLAGRGIGFIDMHLLAAAFIASCRLWTQDKKLGQVAEELFISFCP